MYPDRGGVGRDIDQLTNRSLVDLVNVNIELDLKGAFKYYVIKLGGGGGSEPK